MIKIKHSTFTRGQGLFGGGQSVAAAPPAPPAAPTRDDAAERAQQDYANRVAARKAGGLDSTILTSAAGDTSQPNVGKKTLLGS